MSVASVRLPVSLRWRLLVLGCGVVFGLFAAEFPGSGVLVVAGVVVLCLATALTNWRITAAGLAIYTVLAGFVTVATFPVTATASLVKDVLFVIPLYLGLVADPVARRSARALWDEHRWVVRCAFAFASVVILQMFNPNLPSQVIGLVGLRVWILYIPFLLVGFVLGRQGRAASVIGYLAAVAAVPLAVGIAQAVLMRMGLSELATFWYGEAAPAITQRFATFEVGGGVITRVASTLPHTAQYFALTMAATAVGLALVSGGARKGPSVRSRIFLGLAVVAGLLSGARGALFSVPLLVFLFLVVPSPAAARIQAVGIGGRRPGRFGVVVLATLALAAASAVLRVDTVEVGSYLGEVASAEFTDLVIDGTTEALDSTLVGLGTGSNTNATRYLSPGRTLVVDRWLESWYVKALVELSIVGVAVQLALVASVLFALLRVARRSNLGAGLRGLPAAAIALVSWTALYAAKGGFMDTEPMNMLFWFVPGLALGAERPAAAGDA